MPTANGGYYDNAASSYDHYDDNTSESSHNTHSMQWTGGANGVHTDGPSQQDVTYQTPLEERASYKISINPRLKSKPQDEMSRHMLYETALVDCKSYDILSLEETDALKKELARLIPRIEATQRKLALENKVRNAAQNLQKLHRADTPQSPESPRKVRGSLQRQSSLSANGSQQVDDELASSQKRLEELNDTLKSLLDRRGQVERSLLRHTAAILAEQREQDHATASSRHRSLDDDTVSEYEPDEFDGIRDILGGKTIGKLSRRVTGRMQDEQVQQLQSMQARIEHLNSQLRRVIDEAGRSRGITVPPEMEHTAADDPATQVNQDLARLENNVAILEQEQQNTHAHFTQLHSTGQESLNAVSAQLKGVNNNLHKAIISAPSTKSLNELPQPPQGSDHHQHIGYLQSLLESVEHMFQSHHEDKEALAKTAGSSQKLDEYESTVGGLWDILSAEKSQGEQNAASKSPRMSQTFSLAAFSSIVQHVFDRASSAQEQQDILRRQIQQQRELNNKSDEEKERQFTDLQAEHQQMIATHEQLQDKLAQTVADHASSENETSQLRAELANVENEFEQLRKTAETKQQEHGEMARQLQLHQSNHEQAQSELRDVHSQLLVFTSAKGAKEKETKDLESEVVRLTTELAMAKAELDGAYGSRAERAREAQAGEVEGLKERAATLEKELAEMTSEFQELTRESVDLERERSQLDTTIDGLRERCEALEAQLSDEKVRWLGKSPTADQQAREQTSMAVMRSEFKKMMRDARAEGVKLLRAEQEQRRSLEAELRRLRQSNTPLRKAPNDAS